MNGARLLINMAEAAKPVVLDFFLRCTADGILITDQDGAIELINPAAASMLVIRTEATLGHSPKEIFPQNMALVNLFSRSGDQMLEVRLPRRRLALGMASTLDDGRRAVLLQDITEKAEMESRREALIASMAHDLRNPISALNGFAELVEKFGPLNGQQQRFMTRIKQTAGKVYEVVGSLVDLAWIEAGMPLQHRPIDLRDIINRAVNGLTHFALERHCSIAVSVQDPMPTVLGDPDRIQLVVHNLLHNALLYSEQEQAVAIHAWGDENEAYCSVADRGIGISDDELGLIFDRMYRSRDERVRDLPGGGLGLTVARTIITRHGGDIWASSNLGVGSTFTFVLPAIHL
jgi:signal transduction histidine kinase